VLVGAGDIALCNGEGDQATARLLDAIPGTVFTLGDNVYSSGTPEEFANCYDPSWGRHKARTRPVPGNHDYATRGAAGYYNYFGASAGEPGKGYYSYDLGAWHIIVLNSEIDAGPASAQVGWLRADLAAHPARCTLAMWHKPLFSSGPHGDDGTGAPTRSFWDALYEFGADVVLGGHDHDYERFAPQAPDGSPDPARGIRQFVAGTGGASPYYFTNIKPNSEIRLTGLNGVLKLTLHEGSYDWEFIPAVGLPINDAGTGECH
jgi:3',5'-cyclic AMP phosphodiesterase CpdA